MAQENEQEICAVCHEGLEDNVVTLECGHSFHATCAVRWFRTDEGQQSCPMCRAVPDFDFHMPVRKQTLMMYARRKSCPQELKRLVQRVRGAKERQRIAAREAREFRNEHKEVFRQYNSLIDKRWRAGAQIRRLDRELVNYNFLLR